MTLSIEWTDEALMAIPHVGKCELINGELHTMAPTGTEHSDIAVILVAALVASTRPARLGRVYESNAGYRMSSGNVLSPDVSFISAPRLKGRRADYKRFFKGAPDLAVEILSPNDSHTKTIAKLDEYFQNGTLLAWIIDADQKTLEVFTTPHGPNRTLTITDALTATPLIPNFYLPLADLFESPDFD
jgi:Uma2 family endonuclease